MMGESLNFIEQIVEEDIESGRYKGHVNTRFPPEPNGYLHIGHTKAICINFETAEKYGGITNLRFDDTNPVTEETLYVDAIKKDIKWLGFDWEDRLFFASDYFAQLYEYALKLIKDGFAYVDDSSAEEIAEMKGTPTEPGVNSPFRERSIEENLQLFQKMKDGALVMSLKTGTPIIPMSFQVEGNWRINSWDRKRYPPFFVQVHQRLLKKKVVVLFLLCFGHFGGDGSV